ncbi:MAG: succinylglutamate-semialdehyde dehydrogenase [Candidatus Hydrogenedentes bacterium]|nr:succinylglutamate-semialdehyde dehydrogenase [Candidatus Hydrogenedentota bacterium]
MNGGGHFIAGRWIAGQGRELVSLDPATNEPVWSGRCATAAETDRAISAARDAFNAWARTTVESRRTCLERFVERLEAHQDRLTKLISRETGKPFWESRTEVAAIQNKIELSLRAYAERCPDRRTDGPDGQAVLRFRPHGAVAVLGPFNLPGHLPNSHIVPALLTGNTVVFKPSELTPKVGEYVAELWHEVGLPPGVLNLVQGDRETGRLLAEHPGIDGLFFTGSAAVGRTIHQAFTRHPEKILALEMGGNNPLVVFEIADVEAAAYPTVLSAFITSGQRCSCARRLIVPTGSEGDRFLSALLDLIPRIRVGPCSAQPEPFMGPLISEHAANNMLSAQERLLRAGSESLFAMERLSGSPTMLTPGIIDVTRASNREDVELFGPLLQVIRVPDFDAAIYEANSTAYGLTAGLLSDNRSLYERFQIEIRAGVINWNRQLTGANSALPFGGIKASGNHRPSAYFAADYCSYPVASIETEKLVAPREPIPGIAP